MIYLDTHVAVWLYQGELERFSRALLRHIETADLLVSPIVALELQYLFETGRILEEAAPIVEYLRKTIGLEICPLPFAEVVGMAVSQRWTRDPFDRVIAAQAMLRQTPLVTKDATMRENYANAMW